ncbi:hypothetical protein P692DRAFT_201869003 [Suillus brevipes Sb2]|nr:hypothetical protein P692DRAFT_201869003 [Suillus brevipes Sb2]
MDLEAQTQHNRRQKIMVIIITIVIAQVTHLYHLLFLSRAERIPYHTSILTGQAWVYEDLADDADDEDAVPCVVDPFAARVVLREIRIQRALFFHKGFELPKVDGIAEPEQKWSGFLRLGRIGHFRERRVMGVRAMHLVHVLMRIALLRRAMTPGVNSKRMIMIFSSAPFYTSNVRFPDHNTPLSAADPPRPTLKVLRSLHRGG